MVITLGKIRTNNTIDITVEFETTDAHGMAAEIEQMMVEIEYLLKTYYGLYVRKKGNETFYKVTSKQEIDGFLSCLNFMLDVFI